ncbi:multicopper oxidase domain-containing protein [Bradyrhizobium sp.]|uniref:multicopper oxidase family protein n=1 Tax=Bradyrhizobium sp. TaxID=376 RepID=UPI0023A0A43E|nr:multicopper oxidase domain-containing protein [Bradyrhizobium sp.]MDE2377408.1 multicopper oxidase domain-containing protein [Bradyrhizobium sp.]
MTTRNLTPTRRALIAGLSASAAGLLVGGAGPEGPVRLALHARSAALQLRPGQPATAISELGRLAFAGAVRVKRGDRCEVTLRNDLPVPVAPAWRGLDDAAAAEPLLGRAPIPAGTTGKSTISMPHAGTLLADLRLFEDGLRQPVRPLAVIVEEAEPLAVDRDEVFLIEDWRLDADGSAMVPGSGGVAAAAVYTVNGTVAPDFTLRTNARLRLRFINGCQRAVIAAKIEGLEVMVMALDGQPAEPFAARNGALVLAPGGRADVFLDWTAATGATTPILIHDGKEARPVARFMTSTEPPVRPTRLPPPAPLPSNGLPAEFKLGAALRFDIALDAAGWLHPTSFSPAFAPAFGVKAGRTVVLAVSNPGPIATVFHLHGHHFRLLDRLDDGWKPYWLDTLAVEPGQTARVAFAADHPGRWLMESVATEWTAPRLVRWYAVE